MLQEQELVLWYGDRKEPNIQIKILRDIAINGKRTKPELRESLGYADTTIANIMATDEKSNIERRLFWRNGEKKVNIKQTQYSLTNRAIKILMLGCYKDNEDNRKLKRVRKPYLNLDEFKTFVSLFEKEHSYTYNTKTSNNFKQPIEPIISLYLKANSAITDQLISESKNKNKLQKIVSSIKSDELELQKINEKIENKKYHIFQLLSDSLISSLKK